MLDTRKMKNTIVWRTCVRSRLVCSNGRIRSIEAPVVPMNEASTDPSARNPVFVIGVASMSPRRPEGPTQSSKRALDCPMGGRVVYSCCLSRRSSRPEGGPCDQGHRRARRIFRKRPQALQEAVREGRAPLRIQKASALRKAQRSAQAQGPRRPQEGQAARTDVRLAGTSLDARRHSRDLGRERRRRRFEAGRSLEPGTEWNAVRALLAHEAVTEMGRNRAT